MPRRNRRNPSEPEPMVYSPAQRAKALGRFADVKAKTPRDDKAPAHPAT